MNITLSVVRFSLSGFSTAVKYRAILSFLTLLCYCLILVLNLSLILTIILHKNLHEPMCIILCNLCIGELYGTAGFYPKFISDLLSDSHVISYEGCLIQVYVVYSNAMFSYSVLALMAYDRYVAICRPLEYHAVMCPRRTAVLVCLAWLVPLCCQVVVVGLTSTLQLCGSHIDKLYCENWSIVKLACGSTKANDVVGLVLISFYSAHAVCIACSYMQLTRSALKSKEGRKKFLRTCVPHLLCLLNITAALLFDQMYSRYRSASVQEDLKNFMGIQFLLIPPILNPIVYGVILTKIRKRMVHSIVTAYQRLKLKSNV